MATPLQVGDKVQYTKYFLKQIVAGATDPIWRRKGVVVGIGSTCTTWHCATCDREAHYSAPSLGADRANAPQVSPCCKAALVTRDHKPGKHAMETIVRVQFAGEDFEVSIARGNLARIGAAALYEELKPCPNPA